MGWAIGYAVGLAIVLLVVALLLVMIRGARTAADQAEQIVVALESARDRSQGLWDVGIASAHAQRITRAATAARGALERPAGPIGRGR